MERRATQLHRISTSVVCRQLNFENFGKPVDGRMKNCCSNGVYAELRFNFKRGTVLVVRATGSSCGFSREEGFRSLGISQVKWSPPIAVEGEAYYGTGLKYVEI